MAGHDPVVGCLVDVMCGDRVTASNDCFDPAVQPIAPPHRLPRFLVSDGLFSVDELQDALVFLQDGLPTPSNSGCPSRVADCVTIDAGEEPSDSFRG